MKFIGATYVDEVKTRTIIGCKLRGCRSDRDVFAHATLGLHSIRLATFLEAWFTATSALTVTGLTIVSTANYWTWFGQSVILVLMQVGGLGLIVLTTVFLSILGMKIQLGRYDRFRGNLERG